MRGGRKALYLEIRWVCRAALRIIGKDLSDARSWLFKHRWHKGGACPRTGAKLQHATIGGRTTCWSPGRQKLRYLIPAFARGIGEGLEVLGRAVEKVVRGREDVAGMILGRLEAIEDELARHFRRAALKAGILVEAADEEEPVAHAPGGLAQVAVAAHRRRGHRLQAVRAVLRDEVEHVHEPAAEVIDDFHAGLPQGRVLPLVVGKAELLEHLRADHRVGTRRRRRFPPCRRAFPSTSRSRAGCAAESIPGHDARTPVRPWPS